MSKKKQNLKANESTILKCGKLKLKTINPSDKSIILIAIIANFIIATKAMSAINTDNANSYLITLIALCAFVSIYLVLGKLSN